MPVIDTVVLFAAADSKDPRHEKAYIYLEKLSENNYIISCLALLEFDIVLKSRGLPPEDRMEKLALLMADYPQIKEKTGRITPLTLYLLAKLEMEYNLDYFDAGVAAEALQHDGIIISTDRAFDKVPNIERKW